MPERVTPELPKAGSPGGAGAAPLVSVLTPAYNGEAYLVHCVESVLKQTYRNWEYIIVNNRSEDRTAEIARAYAAKDSRIRVHDNAEFVNCERNHNIAARLISPASKYCKFVAADDGLYPECLERMVALAEAHPRVGMVGAYGINDRGDVLWQGLPPEAEVVPGRDMCRAKLMGGPYIFGTPTTTLVRSDLVRERDEFYNVDNIHSDTEVCYKVLRDSDWGFIHQVLVYRRSNNESLSSYSRRLNTYLPSQIQDILAYGPAYLTPGEIEEALRLHLHEYYHFLAQSLVEKKGAEFWGFHRDALKKLGFPLDRRRLWTLWLRKKLRP